MRQREALRDLAREAAGGGSGPAAWRAVGDIVTLATLERAAVERAVEICGGNVPRAAIVRHEGEAFIFIATKDGEFTKKEIELEHPTPDGWFVHEGLKPGDKIVVSGAQQLLSEESKGKD